MRKTLAKLKGWLKTGIAALVLAGMANISAACAAQAKSLFKAMSDYLGAKQ